MHRLTLQSLTKSYDGHKVVDDVSMEVKSGEVVGLLGPNGAGKTSTFFMVLGLLQPDGGKIFLDGEDISLLPIYRRARLGLQYLPQEPSVFRKLTVAENIMAILETLEPDPQVRQEPPGETAGRSADFSPGPPEGLGPLRGRAAPGGDHPGPGHRPPLYHPG